MSPYRRDFDETKYISFLTKKKKNWTKVSNNIKREFNGELVYHEK